MDYTVIIVRANGDVSHYGCATEVDVSTWIISTMRSQFKPDIDAGIVSYHIIDNTKGR